MITDNLEAYVNARIDLALHIHTGLEATDNWDECRSLKETASIRQDGLISIIRMAIREAAAEPPHNPFAINGDVNQPDHNEHGTFPPPPKKEK
jgi:predicted TIM-barrel fold metal-dependent hydrolase